MTMSMIDTEETCTIGIIIMVAMETIIMAILIIIGLTGTRGLMTTMISGLVMTGKTGLNETTTGAGMIMTAGLIMIPIITGSI